MEAAGLIMLDASLILNRPDTGKQAVAAETEVIELLLQTKRTDPNSGGGGGGTDPGSGSGGTTDEAAIAMIGPGINQNERRQDSESHSKPVLPAIAYPKNFGSDWMSTSNELTEKTPMIRQRNLIALPVIRHGFVMVISFAFAVAGGDELLPSANAQAFIPVKPVQPMQRNWPSIKGKFAD